MPSMHCPWRATYTPGRWIVLSGPSSLVVMQPAPAKASELLNRVWDDVIAASSVSELITELFAWGLDAMPNLAVIIHAEGRLHSLLRGSLKVVDAASGNVLADGSGAITWRETQLSSDLVRIDMDDVNTDELLQLPLVIGAVSASAIMVDARQGITLGREGDTVVAAAGVVDASTTPLQNDQSDGTDAQSGDQQIEPEGSSRVTITDAALAAPVVAGGLAAATLIAPAGVSGLSFEESVFDAAEAPQNPEPTPEDADSADANDSEAAAPVLGGLASPDDAAFAEPVEQVEPDAAGDGGAPVEDEVQTEGESAGDAPVLGGLNSPDDDEFAEPLPSDEPAETPEALDPAEDPEPEAPEPEVAASPEVSLDSDNTLDDQASPEDLGTPDQDVEPDAWAGADRSAADDVIADEAPAPGDAQAEPQGLTAEQWPEPDDPSMTSDFSLDHDGLGSPDEISETELSEPVFDQNAFAEVDADRSDTAADVSLAEDDQSTSPGPADESQPPAAPEAEAPALLQPGAMQTSDQLADEPMTPVAPPPLAPPSAGPPTQLPDAPPPGDPFADPAPSSVGDRNTPRVRPLTDHAPIENDGATVFATGIAATHKPPQQAGADGNLVLAAMCPFSHANAPGSLRCRVCGSQVDSHNPRLVAAPILTTLVINDGQVLPLDGVLLIGRAPTASASDANAQIVRVHSPNQDVSRSHVRIAPTEWTIEVRDLHSTNGTLVLNPGDEPMLLSQGESVIVEVGGSLDLGDGVIIEFRPGS